jgi:UDP-N-acetylmuramate-alanine ligase
LDEATGCLLKELLPGDVLIVLSAGDADQVSTNVLAAIQERK